MKVAIVGAGLSGLACASKLLKEGFEVHIYEKEKNVGGLARYSNFGEYRFPETYHHVLRSDKYLNETLNNFKIPIDWKKVDIGIYANSEVYPFNGPLDLIRFSPLSFQDRVRLGWFVLNTKDNDELHKITIKEWVTAKASVSVYEKFVKPLISTYFGSSESIAAAYLARRWCVESKHASNNLGYTDFPKLVDSYVELIAQRGTIRTQSHIEKIQIRDKKISIYSKIEEKYDSLVLTCPPPEATIILKDGPPDVVSQLNNIDYRSCLCLVLRLEEKASEYYWINILDQKMPFIACFEHTNLNSRIKGGLLYVVSYMSPSEHNWKLKDSTIFKIFKEGLEKVFKKTLRVKTWKLFRARYGTPVYRVGYRNIAINPHPTLYFAGIYRAYPEIRSSGPAIRTGIEAAEKVVTNFQ